MSRPAAKLDAPRATLEYIGTLHRRMEEFAAKSEWESLEALMAERDALLNDFRDDSRRAAIEAAQASTDRILKLAAVARLEVAGKLARLQRGRRATDIYRANR